MLNTLKLKRKIEIILDQSIFETKSQEIICIFKKVQYFILRKKQRIKQFSFFFHFQLNEEGKEHKTISKKQ